MEVILQNEIDIDSLYDITETKDYYIIRAYGKIHFHNKNEQMTLIKTLDIGLDHELGYRKIVSKANICFFITHSTPRKDDDLTGEPGIAHLNAYTIDGKLWSYQMSEWSISRNFGGLFIIDDNILFNDEINNSIYTFIMEANSGKIINKVKSPIEMREPGNSIIAYQNSVAFDNNIIFSDSRKNVVEYKLKDNSISHKILCDFNSIIMCQNKKYIAIHAWVDQYRIFIIEKKTGEIKYRVDLGEDIELERMVLTHNSNRLLYLVKHTEDLVCVDFVTSKQLWSIPPIGEIYQLAIDKKDNIFLYVRQRKPYILILDSQNGKDLNKIISNDRRFDCPFFIINNQLLVAKKWGKSCLYKLE
ncbi:MAG: hypothetical protein N4A49_09615 [Marinifilaceae bacterium]|jgi:hypothetical protein|nr:hypothetical protein [Marinifilaceae bacterium]